MVRRTSEVLQKSGPKLIGYFPAGYPTVDESVAAAIEMCRNGVDVLELGVPYSDPVMDGLVIQKATEEALEHGFKLPQVFDAVRRITAEVETPVLVMSYWNPVMQYGIDRFAHDLKDAGGAGLITPDLIPDEAGEWLKISDELDLDRVFLVAPTSTPDRAKRAAELSRGFTYAVSTMGITGARDDLDTLARGVVAKLRETGVEQNVAVGIGVSTADQVKEVNTYADGAIVGSVFVRAYQEGGIEALGAKVRELVAGLARETN